MLGIEDFSHTLETGIAFLKFTIKHKGKFQFTEPGLWGCVIS